MSIISFLSYPNFTITGDVIAYNGSNVVYQCGDIDVAGIYSMNQSLTTTGTCLTINVSDVTLDCDNFNIDGDGGGSDYGIFADGSSGSELTNITINNCNVTDFGRGVYFDYTDNSVINNITANSNSRGIDLNYADSNNLTNITTNLNSQYGIYIYRANSNNLTNITANSNTQTGIYVYSSDSNIIRNSVAQFQSGTIDRGITLSSSNLNTLINVTANDNYYGIYLSGSFNNTLTNITANSNNGGVYIVYNSDYNNITNSYIENNSNVGLSLDILTISIPDYNLIYNNLFNNTNNLDINEAGGSCQGTLNCNLPFSYCMEYACIWTGSCIDVGGSCSSETTQGACELHPNSGCSWQTLSSLGNYWNTTQQTGTRIYSNGTNVGGNYYTNSMGNGFSDTCNDVDEDGFCDLGYNITNDVACTEGVNCSTLNVDYLAYSDEGIVDIEPPTATFTCSPSSVTVGESVTCTCSGTDLGSGINNSETSDPVIITTTTVGSFTPSGCSVTDLAGNSANATGSYTVSADIVDDGGGRGGNGGSTALGTPTTTKSYLIIKVSPEEPTTITSFEGTGVKEITIEVNQETINVKIEVAKYEEKPTEVSVEVSGKNYNYLEINTENLNESLEKAIVKFEVGKTWVSNNSLNKEDLVVSKFDEQGEVWNELETIFDSEDDNFYYYVVELDSFSFFAIGEKVKKSIQEIPETTEESRSILKYIKGVAPLWMWGSLVVILSLVIIIVLGYLILKLKIKRFLKIYKRSLYKFFNV